MSTSLNAATMPLAGRHLIEASAGTGKTFTVANLYLRLLIDAREVTPPTVENILVVTFTNAATEELRSRLRSRIAAALQVLDGELNADKDDTLAEVLKPHLGDAKTRERLELAYQSMDQAAIFTIHSFCDRVLREQAFESGEMFDAELQADVDTLRQKAAEAWWRAQITPLSAEATEVIPQGWRSPDAVLRRLSPVIADPAAELVPQYSEAETQQIKQAYQSAWQVFRDAWAADGEVWGEQVRAGVADKSINKAGNTFTVDTVSEAIDTAVSVATAKVPPGHVRKHLSLLGNTLIAASANKRKNAAPQSTLGDQIDALVTAAAAWEKNNLVALQNSAKALISRDLSQRKQLARQRTFDDLLLQLHAVLHSDNGQRLIELLQTRYPVALIDEFQDTDRIQYEIFDCLFPTGEDQAGTLYLIGDPKQSIYRFRGADIAMYLRARSSATGTHSLDKNWRSSARLINALNVMYARSEHPFGNSDIEYQPVTAGGRAEGRSLSVAGAELAPLQFDWIELHEDTLPNISISEHALARACAQRVGWLLDNANLGDASLEAKDIAVLVSKHTQAQAVRNALLAVGIVSAMQSRESVFNTPEALDMLALLRVLARPGDSSSLSRVLVSPLGGYSAATLLRKRDDAVAWQQIEDDIHQCREQCRQAGPQAAVLCFMALFNSRVNALATPAARTRGIDRILGNYLHLADVLQTAWQDQPELSALLKTAQHWREQGADEALQLRLESDEALVQIVTVHKSKGLEYPVVMLPFAFIGKDTKVSGDSVAFTENGLPRLDVGSDQLAARQAELAQTLQDEALRTLYVALTRAEQSCWIGATPNKNLRHSALAQLLGLQLHGKADADVYRQQMKEAIDALAARCEDISISNAFDERSASYDTSVSHAATASNTERAEKNAARVATRQVRASWRVGSYTGLARGATHAVEQPDHDAADVPAAIPEIPDYRSPFHFPRGASAGTLVHAVFEHLDFRNTDQQTLQDYAQQQLRAHGVDTQWTPALCQLVQNTLHTPLNEHGLSLGVLDKKDRLDELGFHFPVQSLQADSLVALLRDAGVLGADDDLSFDQLDGYMTGFIDLTFRYDNRWYIADYKSNHLGYDSAEYQLPALQQAMQHHRYDLQYLIYVVALRRYLQTRLPEFDYERDFGGAYYLFVRGMPGATDAMPPDGVYHAKPDKALLDALDQLLSGANCYA